MFLAYPLRVYNPKFNYEAYGFISEAMKTGDTKNLCEAFKSFYDQAKAYEEKGDKAGWPSYRTYTEGGIMALTKYYNDNKLFQFDEYTAEPTQFMIENNPTIKKLYDEMFFKVVMGTAPISEYDNFIAQYDRIYLATSSKEVNDWYKAKK
jgi:putative aldouronate transport system substrate-binding protein